jgi:positive regulator of sigma E activity
VQKVPIIFAPSAICALLATWFSGVTDRRDTAMMLGVCLVLILIAIEFLWPLDPYIGRYEFWLLLGAFAILSANFFAIARFARVRPANEHLPR